MMISVASGKGGTGKTMVATSLALSLAIRRKVQLLDCDVEEPNAHIFLNPVITRSEPVCIQVPVVDNKRCTHCGKCSEICAYHAISVLNNKVMVFSNLCHGCGACSFLCPEKAISEQGRQIGVVESGQSNGLGFVQGRLTVGEEMPTPVIRKVKEWSDEDGVVVIDVSPGTSCPVVQSVKGSDFCLLVTEPTPFGLNDLMLTIEMVKDLGIPIGIVINRTGNGDNKVQEYCARESVPILLTIPLDINIAHLYSRGITLAEGIPRWRQRFIGLFDTIQEIVYERNCSFKR
jgi:MinD superfamily P-loop ATPase